jgi:hypothetical protein
MAAGGQIRGVEQFRGTAVSRTGEVEWPVMLDMARTLNHSWVIEVECH